MTKIRPARISDVPTIAECCNVSRSGLMVTRPDEAWHYSDYIAQLDAWNFMMTVKAGMTSIFVLEDDFGQITNVITGNKAMGRMSGYEAEISACHVWKTDDSLLDSILIMEMAKYLQTQGFASVVVWVNNTGTLQQHYTQLGGEVVHAQAPSKIGFGWKNIDTLLTNLGAYDVWHSK